MALDQLYACMEVAPKATGGQPYQKKSTGSTRNPVGNTTNALDKAVLSLGPA
jgi:hypothetical protein